jgi:hypothetical protein
MANPIRDFDKIRIKELHVVMAIGNEGDHVAVKYSVYKLVDTTKTECYEKFLSIIDQTFVSTFENYKSPNALGSYDTLCKLIFQYLIDNNIEPGTIEVQ